MDFLLSVAVTYVGFVSDEGYYRNVACSLNSISTVLLHPPTIIDNTGYKQFEDVKGDYLLFYSNIQIFSAVE